MKTNKAFSMVELLGSMLIIGSITTTYIAEAKGSLEATSTFVPAAMEKLALDTLNESTHELITYNNIEERSFTKYGFNVLVQEGRCGAVVTVSNEYVTSTLDYCNKKDFTNKIKITEV